MTAKFSLAAVLFLIFGSISSPGLARTFTDSFESGNLSSTNKEGFKNKKRTLSEYSRKPSIE